MSRLPKSLLTLIVLTSPLPAGEVSFSRQVLPILSDRCFHCHGPDATHREAELRLDQLESVLADRGGHAVIVPGQPEQSELLARITADDPDVLMPPPDSHRVPLSQKEINTLRQWIAEGAKWGQHWAFEKPVRPELNRKDLHPIDELIQRQLAEEGLQPAALAEKHTLLRRLSFDLTGLPPTAAELQRWLGDESPEAWSNQVDRLLKSPHYGERMAMWWLDAARYSDTDGYQGDASRTNWPWRDWVIQAFNENMKFDHFTIEQFAGDLLPDATPEQILATCFHRNHMTNGEGGRDPEESRVDYVIDRVNTTGTVWLGLTLGCVQCHDHKFDPISQRDYYSLSAFFNSIDEDGKAGTAAKPYLKYKSPFAGRALQEAQQVVNERKPLEAAARKTAEEEFIGWLAEQLALTRDGFQPWQVLTAKELRTVEGTRLTQEADGTIQASGPVLFHDDYIQTASTDLKRVTGIRLEIFPHESHTEGKLSRGKTGEFILTDVKLQVRKAGSEQVRDLEIASAVASFEKKAEARNYGMIKDTLDDDPRNGWTTAGGDPKTSYTAVFALAKPLELEPDEELIFVMLQRSTDGDANIGRYRLAVTDQPGPAVRSLQAMPLEQLAAANVTETAQVTPALRELLLEQFLVDHADYQEAKAALDRANQQLNEAKKAAGVVEVMVLQERKEPRTTNVLVRGVWNKPGDSVQPALPDRILPGPEAEKLTRLDLARWLVSPENPLTARVIVNQLWQMFFGAGLVRTPEDFGLQGAGPTHFELLDYLALELIDSGWDLQHVIRLIVTSHTYRQRSEVTPELLARDPENRLLARGSRFRLPAWMLRDAALQSSGLLNPALGGPPVYPYQPEGVWEEMFMGRFQYQPSQGATQYRRTVYAFWRRAVAPTFLFDSAQRRVCETRPNITNTPLHALTLLNNQTTQEAARALAQQVIAQTTDPAEQLKLICRRILSRSPSARELAVLQRERQRAFDYYTQYPEAAEKLLRPGQPEQVPKTFTSELAACALVATLVYNLDEAITHE